MIDDDEWIGNLVIKVSMKCTVWYGHGLCHMSMSMSMSTSGGMNDGEIWLSNWRFVLVKSKDHTCTGRLQMFLPFVRRIPTHVDHLSQTANVVSNLGRRIRSAGAWVRRGAMFASASKRTFRTGHTHTLATFLATFWCLVAQTLVAWQYTVMVRARNL